MIQLALSFFAIFVPMTLAIFIDSRADESPADKVAPASELSLPVRALPDVRLDRWTQTLIEDRKDGSKFNQKAQENFEKLVRRAAESVPKNTTADLYLFRQINEAVAEYQLKTAEDYFNLADLLFTSRDALRNQLVNSISIRHQRVNVLTMMAEEVLYIGYLKYPDSFPKYYRARYFKATNDAQPVHKSNGYELQSGDIVLVDGSGDRLANLIALISNRAGWVSHTLLANVNEKTKELLGVEALVEDGLKLRPNVNKYLQGAATRVFILRGGRPETREAAALASEVLVTKMRAKNPKPGEQAFLPYNVNMDIKRAERDEAYTNLDVVREAYDKYGKLRPEINPYAKKYGSKPNVNALNFFGKNLSIFAQDLGNPGDVLFNPEFRAVGFGINIERLERERLEYAILDYLMWMVEAGDPQFLKISELFESLTRRTISKDQILSFLKSITSSPPVASADAEALESSKKWILEIEKKLPEQSTLRQVVFSTYLNTIYTPDMLERLRKKLSTMPAKVRDSVGPERLRGLSAEVFTEHVEKHFKDLKSMIGKF